MIAPEFLPVWGGTGSYIIELIKYLPKDVNIHVVTLKRNMIGVPEITLDSVLDSAHRNIKIHYISEAKETFFYNVPFQIACLRNVPLLHRKYKFDIIHSHHCHMPDLLIQLAKRIRVPNVVTVHNTIAELRKGEIASGDRFGDLEWSEKQIITFYPLLRVLELLYAKHVSRFIAVSNSAKEGIIRYLKVKAERISTIYNGVDTTLFRPPRNNEMEKKNSRPTVVYMGRIMAKKGIGILIEAMPDIIRRFPHTHFLFVGGGNIPFYIKMMREKRIPRKNFSFTGQVGYFERPKILARATVFVNPSFYENCSISILEAMSCKAAVVASDIQGNREIIKSGRNGMLIPPGNSRKLSESVVSLLNDEFLNKKLGEGARKTVENSFTSKKNASETYKIYKRILQ
jgi:glycosyltransferase involved in cell wall biosynthesis